MDRRAFIKTVAAVAVATQLPKESKAYKSIPDDYVAPLIYSSADYARACESPTGVTLTETVDAVIESHARDMWYTTYVVSEDWIQISEGFNPSC